MTKYSHPNIQDDHVDIKPNVSVLSYFMYGGMPHEKVKSQCFQTYGVKQDFGRGVNVGAAMVEKKIMWAVLKQKSRDAELQT